MNASTLFVNATAVRDPTHTVTLRAKYARKMRGRWGRVNRLAQEVIEKRGFSARAGFGRWLETTIQEQVLEDGGTWQREFLRAGYGRGVKQADGDVKVAKLHLPTEGLAQRQLTQGVYVAAIQAAVQQYSTDLQNIGEAVVAQVDEKGFDAWGDAAAFGTVVADRVQKVGLSRSTVLAVTSVVDVFNRGLLDRFAGLGFRRVGIIPEMILTTAPGVCPLCEELSRQTWTIFDARGVLPAHAHCRCRWRLDIGSLVGLGWWLEQDLMNG